LARQYFAGFYFLDLVGKYEKGGIKFREEFFSRVILQFFTIPINAKLKTSEIRSEIKYTSIRYPTETEIVVETIVVEPNYGRLFRGAGK